VNVASVPFIAMSLPSWLHEPELKFQAHSCMVAEAEALPTTSTPMAVTWSRREPVSSTLNRHSTALWLPDSPDTVNESVSTLATSE
jgi:hypothetical protein